MAKMHEEMVVIKVSELLKDDADENEIIDAELIENLEAVIQELVGDSKLVELIRGRIICAHKI